MKQEKILRERNRISSENMYSVYCDESCHLENDGINTMTLGAMWCPQKYLKKINRDIAILKIKNGFKCEKEIKWTAAGKTKLLGTSFDYGFIKQ